jgi:acyl-CoA thioester hydrolase
VTGSPDNGTFRGGAHHMAMRVYYEDTDTAGIVYYANYLRFIERARTEVLRLCGISQHALMSAKPADRVSFAVTRCEIDYVMPARLDDVIDVKTTVSKMAGASIHMVQEIFRDDQLLIKSLVKVACLNDKGMPTRLPKYFVQTAREILPIE